MTVKTDLRPSHARRPSRTPWVLLTPAAIVLLVLVIYPLVRLVTSSFQDYGLRALFTGEVEFVGFSNYTGVLTDASFWPVILRTVVITGAMVFFTVVLGMAVSQLLTKLGAVMRTLVSVVLVLAWAMPNVARSFLGWLSAFYGALDHHPAAGVGATPRDTAATPGRRTSGYDDRDLAGGAFRR